MFLFSGCDNKLKEAHSHVIPHTHTHTHTHWQTVRQTETHPAVLWTPVVSWLIWSNGWWWITTSPSCVHVTRTHQGSERVHMTSDPPFPELVWGGGRAEPNTLHQLHQTRLPLQGRLCSAVWGAMWRHQHGVYRKHHLKVHRRWSNDLNSPSVFVSLRAQQNLQRAWSHGADRPGKSCSSSSSSSSLLSSSSYILSKLTYSNSYSHSYPDGIDAPGESNQRPSDNKTLALRLSHSRSSSSSSSFFFFVFFFLSFTFFILFIFILCLFSFSPSSSPSSLP